MKKRYLFLVPLLCSALISCSNYNQDVKLAATYSDDDLILTIGDTISFTTNLPAKYILLEDDKIKFDYSSENTFNFTATGLGNTQIEFVNLDNQSDNIVFQLSVYPDLGLLLNNLSQSYAFKADVTISQYDNLTSNESDAKYNLQRLQLDNRYYVNLIDMTTNQSSTTDYYKNENGYVSIRDYDNELNIIETVLTDTGNNPIMFDFYLYNAFTLLEEKDLEIIDNNTIKVNAYEDFLYDFAGISEYFQTDEFIIYLDLFGNPKTFELTSKKYSSENIDYILAIDGEFVSEDIFMDNGYQDNPENNELKTLFDKLANESYSFSYTDEAENEETINASGIVTNQGIYLNTPEAEMAYVQLDENHYGNAILDTTSKTLTMQSGSMLGNIRDLKPDFNFSEDLFRKDGRVFTLLDAYDYVRHIIPDTLFTDNSYMIVKDSLTISFDTSYNRVTIKYDYNFFGQLIGTVTNTITNINNTSWPYSDYEIIEYSNEDAWNSLDSEFAQIIKEYIGYDLELVPYFAIPGGWNSYQITEGSNPYIYLEKACWDEQEINNYSDSYRALLENYGWTLSYYDDWDGYVYINDKLPGIEICSAPQDDFGIYFYTIFIYNMNILE